MLIAKDLLQFLYSKDQQFDLKACMRPAVFVPETARADHLLTQLRLSKSHMAIVVDEYGNTAGVVTLEDLLEEIVGEIADEHDDLESELAMIRPDPEQEGAWLVEAQTLIESFNEHFDTEFVGDGVETIGGLLLADLGRVNNLVGQTVLIEDWQFTVLEADARSLRLLRAVRR